MVIRGLETLPFEYCVENQRNPQYLRAIQGLENKKDGLRSEKVFSVTVCLRSGVGVGVFSLNFIARSVSRCRNVLKKMRDHERENRPCANQHPKK